MADEFAAFRFLQPKPHTRIIHMSWLLSNTEAFFPEDSRALSLARRRLSPDSTFYKYTGHLVSEKSLPFVRAAKIVIKDNTNINSFESIPKTLVHLDSSEAEEKGRGHRQKKKPNWKKDFTTMSDLEKPATSKKRNRSPSVSSDEDQVTSYVLPPQKNKIANPSIAPQLNAESCTLSSNKGSEEVSAQKLLIPRRGDAQLENSVQSAPTVDLTTNQSSIVVTSMYEQGYKPDIIDHVPTFRGVQNDKESCLSIGTTMNSNYQRINFRSPRKNRGSPRHELLPYHYGPLNRGNREKNKNNTFSPQQHAGPSGYPENRRIVVQHSGYESASSVLGTSENYHENVSLNHHQTSPQYFTPLESTLKSQKEILQEGEKAVLLQELKDGSLFGKRGEEMSLTEFKGATLLGLSYLIKLVEGAKFGEKSINPPKPKPSKNLIFSEELVEGENESELSSFPFKELFPLKTLHDLIFLDDQLKKSSSLLNQLKQAGKEYLKKNMKKKSCICDLTRMLLRAFITTRLSGELCYAGGNPNKHTFNAHKLVTVIKYAVKEIKKHVKDSEVEEIMQLWIQKWKNRKIEEIIDVDPLEVMGHGTVPIGAAGLLPETKNPSVSEEEDDYDDDDAYNPIPLNT